MNSHVYVMQDACGFVKVGMSGAIDLRVKAIKSERKRDVSVVWMTGSRADAAAVEAIAHSLLLPKRQEMEWFQTSVEDAVSAIVVAIERAEAGDLSERRRLPCNYTRTRPRLGKPLTVCIDPDILENIKIAAAVDRRSPSDLIRKILADWTIERGSRSSSA